jgi:hypothetical protein
MLVRMRPFSPHIDFDNAPTLGRQMQHSIEKPVGPRDGGARNREAVRFQRANRLVKPLALKRLIGGRNRRRLSSPAAAMALRVISARVKRRA